jgi:probable rRNA maturation factor
VDPDSKRLRVSVSDGTGRAVRDGGLSRWLAATAPARTAGEVSIALVSDARMRALNRKYRGQNSPTDVLSFGSDQAPADAVGISPSSWGPTRARAATSRRARAAGAAVVFIVGDIVIATGVARRQATEAGHSYQSELRVLALHGLLHLLGHDHHDRHDQGQMARLEARLRRKGGLAAGLIERAAARPSLRRGARRATR